MFDISPALHMRTEMLFYGILQAMCCIMRLTSCYVSGTQSSSHSLCMQKIKSMSVLRYLNYIFLILRMMYIVIGIARIDEGGQRLWGGRGHFYFYLLFNFLNDSLFPILAKILVASAQTKMLDCLTICKFQYVLHAGYQSMILYCR